MSRYGSIGVALAVLALAGYLGGEWGEPASAGDALRQAITRAGRLPESIGEWEGRPNGFDPLPFKRMGVLGGVGRNYRNTRTADEVEVLLVCGRPGPISVHTPDVCLVAAGYEPVGSQVAISVPDPNGKDANFLRGRFFKRFSPAQEGQIVYWTWGDARAWQTPSNPRLSFAGRPALFKLYVSRVTTGKVAHIDEARDQRFLTLLLAELEPLLWPASDSAIVASRTTRVSPGESR